MHANDLVSGIKFESTRVSTSTYVVQLIDHSRLGLRMGMETTQEIEHWTFANADLAVKFATLLIERIAEHDPRINAQKSVTKLVEGFAPHAASGGESSVDLISVGVAIGRRAGDVVIGGFSYPQTTTIRVVGDDQ